MSATTNPTLAGVNLHDVTTEKFHTLGAKVTTQDGRVYRYAKNASGTALSAGAELEANVTTATALNGGTAGTPAGSRTVATTTTIATPANYEDGTLVASSAKHLVSGVVSAQQVSLVDPLDVAVASGASAANLYANPLAVKVKSAGATVGTAETAVPAGSYFWAFVSA